MQACPEPLFHRGELRERIELHCGDCLQVLRSIADASIDLILTDPPYGIDIARKSNNFGVATEHSRRATAQTWDTAIPDSRYFKEMFRVSRNQIVFGANYFWNEFYPTQCYIIWDKRGTLPKVPFCDTEFAWTSFIDRMPKKYTVINHGFIRGTKDEPTGHPTQKPTELFTMILEDFSRPGNTILDPFAGSFSVGVACMQTGRNFIGVEISEDYYRTGKARVEAAQAQPPLFAHEREAVYPDERGAEQMGMAL